MHLLISSKINEFLIDEFLYDNDVAKYYIHYSNFDKRLDTEINTNFYNEITEIINEYSNNLEIVKDYCELKNNVITFCKENYTDNIISYFDRVEIICDDIETFENINNVLPQTDIPIIINICELTIDYVHSNLRKYDELLKQKCPNIRYIIKYNLLIGEAHFEDISSSCDEVLNALNKIMAIKNKILKYNLSPFEQIMYVYDIIKNRPYKKDNSNYINSRDIVKVLNGNSIVCLGYSKLFEAILTELDIESTTIFLANDETDIGHARNMVAVYDNKYDLNHILFFDVTSDARREKNVSNNYLNNYVFFARNVSEMNQRGEKNNYQIVNKPIYNIDDTKLEIENITTSDEAVSMILKIKKCWQNIDTFNYLETIEINSKYKEEILELLLNQSDFYCMQLSYMDANIFEIIKDLYELTIEMLDRKISIEQFTKCLYRVRRIEYYQEPGIYKLSYDDFLKIFMNRCIADCIADCNFNITKVSKEDFMLKFIVSDKKKIHKAIEEIDFVSNINDTKKMENDIERMKLLACLNKLKKQTEEENISSDIKVKDAIMLIKK